MLSKIVANRANWAWPYAIILTIFVIMPLVMIVYYSFQDAEGQWSLHNFHKFFLSTDSVNTLIYSIGIAMITTILCILLGYPAAYFMAKTEYRLPKVMASLFILPMWINVLLRTLATVALFDFAHLPLGEGALVFGMVYNFLPFMVYPIYNTMLKMDGSLIEAAQDLGASPRKVFTMVFMPTISTFALAELLTMNNVKLFGTLIQENINAGLLGYGAALSLIVLILIGLTSFFDNEE